MHRLMLLVILLHVPLTCCALEFGEVTSALTLGADFVNQSVRVIQEDSVRPGNLLLATDHAILTIPEGAGWSDKKLIAGGIVEGHVEGNGTQSRFNVITGIVQQPHRYLILDGNNHCLRQFNFQTNITAALVGQCKSKGDGNGTYGSTRFSSPWDVISDVNHTKLYIADRDNHKIKLVDLLTKRVTTVYHSPSYQLIGLASRDNSREFYVVVPHGLLHIRNPQENWLVGNTTMIMWTSNVRFSEQWLYKPSNIKWLNHKTLLVVEVERAIMNAVDLESKEVTVVCTGKGYINGNISTCKLNSPQTILVTNQTILIGEKGRIRKMPYIAESTSHNSMAMECKPPPPVTNAMFTRHTRYTLHTEVEYWCIGGYVSRRPAYHKLVCTATDSNSGQRTFWKGENIQCKISVYLALMVVFITSTIAVTLVAVVIALCIRHRNFHRFKSKRNNTEEIILQSKTAEGDGEPSEHEIQVNYENQDSQLPTENAGSTRYSSYETVDESIMHGAKMQDDNHNVDDQYLEPREHNAEEDYLLPIEQRALDEVAMRKANMAACTSSERESEWYEPVGPVQDHLLQGLIPMPKKPAIAPKPKLSSRK